MSTKTELNGTGTDPIEHRMKFKTVMMTPKWAEQLLQHNHPKNRKIKWRKVEQYSRDMKAGMWRLTHQGVAIDEEGWLIDGQNRLTAVVESDCAVPMLLIQNAPNSGMVAVDHMAARSIADSAKIGGEKFDVPDTTWPSIARSMLFGLQSGPGGSQIPTTHQEIIQFAKGHRKAIQFAYDITPNNKRGKCSAGVRAVLARAYYLTKERERVEEFGRYLMDGMISNRDTDQAVIKLRNWLEGTTGQGGNGPRREIYAKTEEALRAFIAREPVNQLRQAKEELFPIPGGDLTTEE